MFDIDTANGQLRTRTGVTLLVDETYTVIVVADDGRDTAPITVSIEATAEPPNNPPVFSEGASATRSVIINARAGTNIGQPFRATDADTGDTVTYSLEGTDAASFRHERLDGPDCCTKAGVTLEDKTYNVTVVAADQKGASGKDCGNDRNRGQGWQCEPVTLEAGGRRNSKGDIDGPRHRNRGQRDVAVGQLAQRFIRLAKHIECHVSYLYSGNYGCGQISTGHGDLHGRRGSGKERRSRHGGRSGTGRRRKGDPVGDDADGRGHCDGYDRRSRRRCKGSHLAMGDLPQRNDGLDNHNCTNLRQIYGHPSERGQLPAGYGELHGLGGPREERECRDGSRSRRRR